MSKESIQNAVESITSVWAVVDQILSAYTDSANLQLPMLMTTLCIKTGLDDKKKKELDPIVRFYIRQHPDWEIVRGAHGGITRVTDKKKKEEDKLAKFLAKTQVSAALEAKLTAKPTETNTIKTLNSAPISSVESFVDEEIENSNEDYDDDLMS